MKRRTSWIIAGAGALLLILFAAGFFVAREIGRQQQQLADLGATVAAGRATAPPAASATPAPAPTADSEVSATAAPTAAESPAATAPAQPTAVPAPAAAIPDPAAGPQLDLAASLAPASRGALAQHPDATLYRIGARLDPQRRTIAGTETVRLTNTEDVALDEVYFRLYVNAPHYNEGGIVVDDVRVGGQPVQTALEVDDTALKVALPQPLAPGQPVEISLRFTTTVPTSGGGYGIFNEAGGVFALYDWHPELAVYENGGWLLNPVSPQGDPTNTDSSNYVVAFAAPAGFQVVTSGLELGRDEAAGQVVHRIAGALVRNMVVVASDRFKVASQKAGAAMVNAYYLPGDEQGGRATLATAARALDIFGRQFSPYPYAELDVAEVKLGGGAAGMESTGLIMIGSDFYADTSPLAGLGDMVKGADGLSFLGFTTAHETAHQWWYGVVGSDAYKRPWLDESLTNWSSEYYVEQASGPDAGLLARDVFIALPYRQVLAKGDERLDQPVDIARVDGAGWRATLASVAGQSVADAFYRKWVEGSAITEGDLPPGGAIDKLLGNLGSLDQALATPTPGR